MLPLVVLGATDEIRADIDTAHAELLSRTSNTSLTANEVHYYPTAEAAHRDLTHGKAVLEDGRWMVDVIYGPGVFPALLVARVGSVTSPRLAHTGCTVIVDHGIDDSAGAPRSVLDGEPPDVTGESREVWHVASAVDAQKVIDSSVPGALSSCLYTIAAWRESFSRVTKPVQA